jgi:hypothetical protein
MKQDFFFEKKKQKTFTSSAAPTIQARPRIDEPAQDIKVFWFFSSAKNMLPASSGVAGYLPQPARRRAAVAFSFTPSEACGYSAESLASASQASLPSFMAIRELATPSRATWPVGDFGARA